MKIFVQAKPGSREEKVEQTDGTHFTVSVKEPPVQGKANRAIVDALAKHLGVERHCLGAYQSAQKDRDWGVKFYRRSSLLLREGVGSASSYNDLLAEHAHRRSDRQAQTVAGLAFLEQSILHKVFEEEWV